MIGGTTFRRRVIQREISRVLVLNFWQKGRAHRTAQDNFVLDTAFALIEGHPATTYITGRSPPVSFAS